MSSLRRILAKDPPGRDMETQCEDELFQCWTNVIKALNWLIMVQE